MNGGRPARSQYSRDGRPGAVGFVLAPRAEDADQLAGDRGAVEVGEGQCQVGQRRVGERLPVAVQAVGRLEGGRVGGRSEAWSMAARVSRDRSPLAWQTPASGRRRPGRGPWGRLRSPSVLGGREGPRCRCRGHPVAGLGVVLPDLGPPETQGHPPSGFWAATARRTSPRMCSVRRAASGAAVARTSRR